MKSVFNFAVPFLIMRLFKHGDSLAIVVPEAICKKVNLAENSELEFFEVEPGLVVLASRDYIQNKLKKVIEPLIVKPVASKPQVLPQLLVFSTEAEARNASAKLEVPLKKGEIIPVFGSDKKYYLVSAEFYNKIAAKLAPLLEKEKTLVQLVAESGLQLKEVTAVLQAMKEKGEVIEKRKGNFLLVK
ncbi:MAG: AbrB/MazE/SpoVT family DNA-binding domain-containing protein [Candidatus Micrarchaeota archaeon]